MLSQTLVVLAGLEPHSVGGAAADPALRRDARRGVPRARALGPQPGQQAPRRVLALAGVRVAFRSAVYDQRELAAWLSEVASASESVPRNVSS